MRVRTETAGFFWGTHKGATIQIDREEDGSFYILVWGKDGGYLYDGWAPSTVDSMDKAKAEAVRGACLDRRPTPPNSTGEKR